MTREQAPRLRTLFWEATLRCNAGCPFCGSNCGPEQRPEAAGEDVLRTFARIAEAWDPAEIMVNVTGGEPLLRADLFDVMAEVSRLGFPWGMVTNGSLITEETVRRMKVSGMRTISVSLDGPGEVHEQSRRLPGAFPRIVEGIRLLGEADFLDEIQITTVVTRANLDCLDEMLAYFSTLPVDSWRLAPVDPIGRGADRDELLLRSEDLARLFAFLDRHAFHPRPLLTTSCAHYLGRRDTLHRAGAFRCGAGTDVASILADGSIFVCPNVPRRPELIQGSILRDDFVRVWETGFSWFRDANSRRTGPCAACPAWEACRGDSLHTWNFERQAPGFCAMRSLSPEEALREPMPEPSPPLPEKLRAERPELRAIRISYGSSAGRTVFFTPEAADLLHAYFRWGKRSPVNLCEQMVAAVGHCAGNQAWVEELIPVPLSDRSTQTASFDLALHRAVLEELALLNRNRPLCGGSLFPAEEPLRLLGYLHSHPVGGRAVMSLPDLELHELLRELAPELCFSGLVQPQSRDLCLYWDSPWSPAHVVLFTGAGEVEKWGLAE